MASELDGDVHAVLVGPGATDVAPRLAPLGVTHAHAVDHDDLRVYAPAAYGAALAELVEATGATALVAAGTEKGNEVLAHVAARTDLPMAANCSEVTATAAAPWTLTRIRWGGSLLEDAELDAAVKLLTVAPHAYTATEADDDGATCETSTFTPTLDGTAGRVRVVDHEGRWQRSLAGDRPGCGLRGSGRRRRRRLRGARRAGRAARRRGRLLARGHQQWLAVPQRPGRPDRDEDRPRSCTWRAGSAARPSTGSGARTPRTSWRSTPTRRRAGHPRQTTR